MDSRVPQVQHPSFLILVICLHGRWVEFRALIPLQFSRFWVWLSRQRKGANVNMRCSCERLEVQGSCEVVGHKSCVQ